MRACTAPRRGGLPRRSRAAQVGCLVPARFASLAPCDRLLTRIGTSDSLESNSSSFMVEMQVRMGSGAALCAVD